jgi:hypothetical protein
MALYQLLGFEMLNEIYGKMTMNINLGGMLEELFKVLSWQCQEWLRKIMNPSQNSQSPVRIQTGYHVNTSWICYLCANHFGLNCKHLSTVLTLTLFFPLLVSLSRDLNQPPPKPLEFCSLFFILLMRVSVADVALLWARGGLGLGLGVASLCLTGWWNSSDFGS